MMPSRFSPQDNIPMTVAVTPPCPGCGAGGGYLVPVSQWQDWKGGAAPAQAFPGLRPDQAEQLETGICDRCWDRVHAMQDAEP